MTAQSFEQPLQCALDTTQDAALYGPRTVFEENPWGLSLPANVAGVMLG
jgi:hypothetical protein